MQRLVLIACVLLVSSLSSSAQRVSWRAIRAPVPHYPAEAKGQHLDGSGIFELHIGSDVERVVVVKSTGHLLLDRHAASIFKTWCFGPRVPVSTLRIPLRYVQGPPRGDDAIRRPAAPGYSKLITIFVPPEKA